MSRNKFSNSDKMNEQEIIQDCLQGEGDQFQKIMEKYRGKVMALAWNILGNREDVEDACQEAFAQAYSRLNTFDMQKNFKDWIYAIVYNKCIDLIRKRHRFFNFFNKLKSEPGGLSVSHDTYETEFNMQNQDFFKVLSSKQRIALFLWAVEGYTSEEIAGVLMCTASTARVHLYKARKKVKSILEKEKKC